MAQQVVFYSWQSWTDGGTNRNFIEDCLARAIKEIRKDDSLRLDPVIDRDTQGVPGSADIAKVAEADVFVADVSFAVESTTGRRTPNPNVLVELGYALAKLGEGKVVCVSNLATGRVEDLPFDIRGRSVATYQLTPKSASTDEAAWLILRAEQRRQLVGRLKHALVAVLSAPDPATSQFVNRVVGQLTLAIIFGGEVEDRPLNPGMEHMRLVLAGVAEELRLMACQEPAGGLALTPRLEEVALAIEDAVHANLCLDRAGFTQYVGLVKRAVELATALKRDWLDDRPLDRGNLNAVHRRLYEMRRQLDALVARLSTLLGRSGGADEAYESANSLGLDLCRFGQFDLDPILPGLSSGLSEVGRKLHLAGVSSEYPRGLNSEPVVAAANLERFAGEFGQLVDSLPRPR